MAGSSAPPGAKRAAGPPNKQELKAKTTRETLCRATIVCLDRYGYSEASIGRITEEAGLSRGALTYHYKSKEDLIVDTVDQMLRARLEQPLPGDRKNRGLSPEELIRNDLLWVWKGLDTRNGRAFVEVLLASRTDAALQDRISEKLHAWNEVISTFILKSYQARSGRDEDVLMLWDLCRVFFRGLLIQKAFARDREELQRLAESFVQLVAAGFRPRQNASE
ncbi:MAG: TetR/AcrR family transcriptional regulator [Xanthobacteraceae bacterium]